MKKKLVSMIISLSMLVSFTPTQAAKNMGYKWPVPGYSMTSPFTGTSKSDHRGIDIATSGVAANVYAAKSGTIMKFYNDCEHISQKTSCNDGIGNGMMIDHGDGTFTQYAHMTLNSFPSNIYTGAYVEQGQFLGKVGSSGMSTGYHLHFELRTGNNHSNYWSNTPVNPLDYMDTDDGGTIEPPTGAWITANKSVISIGEDISFNYNATNATGFTLGIDKAGIGRVRTVPMKGNDWYTTSFSESGVYTIYAQCYNSVGSIDSYSVTFKVKADLGETFYASLSTKGCGKPITYETDGSVKIEAENGTSNQIWKFTRQADGDYIIASAVDNKLLEMSAGNTDNGTLVTVGAEDWGGYYQRWYLYEHNDGYYVIHSKHFADLNRVLDLRDNNYSDGTSIQTYEMNLTDAQLFNIYRWDDIQLKSPELNVTVNENTATFNWSEVYGESGYHVKIWKDSQYWDGDAYHIEWNAKKPYTIELPDGYYEAYVDAANYFETKMSNVVKFNVKGTPQQITPAPVSTPIPRFTVIMYTDYVEITNNSESEYIPAIIVAKYNNNVLQGLSSTNIPFAAGEKRTIMTGSGQYKVFVWDSLKGMRPLNK